MLDTLCYICGSFLSCWHRTKKNLNETMEIVQKDVFRWMNGLECVAKKASIFFIVIYAIYRDFSLFAVPRSLFSRVLYTNHSKWKTVWKKLTCRPGFEKLQLHLNKIQIRIYCIYWIQKPLLCFLTALLFTQTLLYMARLCKSDCSPLNKFHLVNWIATLNSLTNEYM